MIRISVALLISLAACPASLTGQVATETRDSLASFSSTIYLQSTLLGGNKYVENGEAHAAGSSYGKLKERLAEVPEAYRLAGEGSRIVTYGRIVSLFGAAMGASTFFVHGDIANYGLSIGGFVVAGVGGEIQAQGRNRVNEAVWLFNNSAFRMQNSELMPDPKAEPGEKH